MTVITGTAGADTLTGGNGADFITGLAGDDVLTGGFGNDILDGGLGDDRLDSGGGDDLLIGGPGDDILIGSTPGVTGIDAASYATSGSGVAVDLSLTGAQNTHGAGVDTLVQINSLIGSAYDDRLSDGRLGGGTIDAGAGADLVIVNSLRTGLFGTDVMGSLTVTLGAGEDTLMLRDTGGQLKVANGVTVTDFQAGAGGDRLDLTAWLNSALAKYTYRQNPFEGGYLRLFQSGADTLLQSKGGAGTEIFSTLLTLRNVDAGALTAANIVFTSPLTNTLAGGAGVDTKSYEGLSRAYSISAAGGSTDVSGRGAFDTLTSIERIQFVDGYFSTGTTDTAARVYRIYEAALGRGADPNGLANWVGALEKGASLQTIGDGFLNSPEFIGRFGMGDNTDFVTLLYKNVLGRDPDQTGLTAWVNYIGSGHSRSEVLTGFSDSPEFVAGTAVDVQHGLWVGDANAAKVARLYDAVFDRLPDAAGEASWSGALKGGASLQTVADGFVGAPEFKATYGALDDSQFVNRLYLNVLGRPADQDGLTSWTSFLASGHSRAEVVVGFSESGEHVSLTAPYIDNGVWFS
jgi:Ca2+-binding RTX toxin-like protein